jgi:lipopolysaccharide export system protein LptA
VSKYIISFLLLLTVSAAFCQKKSKVLLISSSRSEGVKIKGVDVIKVYDGQWKQDFSTMRSDSAYFHQTENSFDALGHVVIHQGDTLNIYADKLHYDGNTKIADLTDNVVMLDKDARLTTDHFSYNTATRIGTYTAGGKIVDKTNTLTSTNGYYFAGSHDAYFRYNVVCITTDARIITDTMRYNSQSKINYFYGPTHIYGQKDKDTLDTDFGTYDTNTEQAFFTKNNTYRQGTKLLKGDTLFYDRIKGFGRAVKHVIFNDNEQKITIHGGLGTYQKSNDLTIVTRDPYIVMVTEDKDTTKNDSLKKLPSLKTADSLSKIAASKVPKGKGNKQALQNLKLPPSTMPVAQKVIDSARKQLSMPVIDSFSKKITKANRDSLLKTAQAQAKKVDKATQDKIKSAVKGAIAAKVDTGKLSLKNIAAAKKDTGNIKRDSIYMSADTIETQILTYKDLSTLQEQERLSHIRDSTKKITAMLKKVPKYISLGPPPWPKDTSYYNRGYFGPPKPKPVKKKAATTESAHKKNVKPDLIFFTPKVVLNDTAHVRIIYAFHKAKIFKSDLQAIADSIFYSNSDSTIRCYTKPMVWTEGSQLSGDTINIHLRNKKLDKMDMFPNAFIVNVDKIDSTHFNQVGGKKMRGFFRNDKLSKVYIDGNAETIYFERDSTTRQITDMERSFSSRLWVYLTNNEAERVGFITKPELRYIPIHMVKADEKVLKGFIWKPKDRPVSKESVLPSYNKKMKADTAKKTIAGEPRPKKLDGAKGNKGSLKVAPGAKGLQDTVKAATADTTKNTLLKKPPAIKTKKDSLIKTTSSGKDSTKISLPAVMPAKKDTTTNKPE